MMKIIKEIFSAENLRKAMVYGSLANPNLSTTEFIHLSKVLRDMDAKKINSNITKEKNIKKAA